ncbi:MAG: hypothetical protein M1296_05465 [Chloroflexi bacterium]|nr:hypothetical protein [Chloroflexota bacterium]
MAGQANDDRLARTLDALVPHRDELWQEVVLRAIVTFDLDRSQLCYDLTSISFFGAYEEAELMTYGYSRDHRPDCQQVEIAATVTAAGGVPIDYQMLAGTVADGTTTLDSPSRTRSRGPASSSGTIHSASHCCPGRRAVCYAQQALISPSSAGLPLRKHRLGGPQFVSVSMPE